MNLFIFSISALECAPNAIQCMRCTHGSANSVLSPEKSFSAWLTERLFDTLWDRWMCADGRILDSERVFASIEWL